MIILSHYREAKEKLPENSILLMRLGDFYEAFESDAEKLSTYGYNLTKRNNISMAGILVKELSNFKAKEDIYIMERTEGKNIFLKRLTNRDSSD